MTLKKKLFPCFLSVVALMLGILNPALALAAPPNPQRDYVLEIDVAGPSPPTVVIDALANDEHPDGLPFALESFTVPSGQLGGTLETLNGAPGIFLFTPVPELNHLYRFDYQIKDSAGLVATQQVWLAPEGVITNIGSTLFGVLQIVALEPLPGPEVYFQWNLESGYGSPAFTILRGPDESALLPVATAAPGSTLYKDSAVTSGQTYCYQVTASTAQGLAQSEIGCLVADDNGTAFLKLEAVVPAGPGALNITWSFLGNATDLELYRGLDGGPVNQLVITAPPGGGSYRDAGLLPEVTYCYQMRSVNSTPILESSIVCRTTDPLGSTAPDPGPPVQLAVSSGHVVRDISDLLVHATDPDGDDALICFDGFASMTTALGGSLFQLGGPDPCKGGSMTFAYYSPGMGITTDSFRFRIIDEAGETAMADAEVSIGLQPPEARLLVQCTNCPGCGPNECLISGLGSTDSNDDPLPESALHWSISDGTAQQGPHLFQHTFPGSGFYTVALTVVDPFNGHLTDSVTSPVSLGIFLEPLIEASCGPNRVCSLDLSPSIVPTGVMIDQYSFLVFNSEHHGPLGNLVQSYNPASGPFLSGLPALPMDGPSLDGSVPEYEVIALVRRSDTGNISTVEKFFPATEYPPTPAFTHACDAIQGTCFFDGRPSEDDHGIATYAWDFGDGATATGESV